MRSARGFRIWSISEGTILLSGWKQNNNGDGLSLAGTIYLVRSHNTLHLQSLTQEIA